MDLKELQKHIRTLAALPEAGAPVISCYLDVAMTTSGYRQALDERVRLLRKSLAGEALSHFEDALGKIEDYLRAGVAAGIQGLAIFARSGRQPFFLPLQFRVPLPNWVAVNTTPDIYHLVDFKDTYHHYVVLISTQERARILGINLGEVTEEVWRESPQLGDGVGRERNKEHHQNRLRERTTRFINGLIRILDRLVSGGGYGHLILAGNSRSTTQIRKALPKHLAAKVVEIVATSEHDRTKDIVAATLTSFIEQEERESLVAVSKLLNEVNTHGRAVAGARDSLEALRRGQVDMLVLARAYEAKSGWACGACGATDVERPAPQDCSECGGKHLREFNIKEEMVRIAERMESGVEVVNRSDALMRLGGVGCLLRFLAPEQYGAKAA